MRYACVASFSCCRFCEAEPSSSRSTDSSPGSCGDRRENTRSSPSAPARQAEVFEKARRLAERHNQGFANLEQVVDAAYRAMVAAFIANEQTYFDAMKDAGDNHA